jgi:hypothetical protein
MPNNDVEDICEEQTNKAIDVQVENNILVDVDVLMPTGSAICHVGTFPGAENVGAIIQILAENLDTSLFTSYKLVVDNDDSSSTILDEYVEILNYASRKKADENFSLFARIVFEEYDVKLASEHVKRLRAIVERTPKKRLNLKPDPLTEPTKSSNESTSHSRSDSASDNILHQCLSIIEFDKFFERTLFNLCSSDHSIHSITASLKSVLSSITFSGWNPPPLNRKCQGDLFYLEIATFVEGVIYVTATATGFYINKTTRNSFDPSPALRPFHSSTLMYTLLGWSSSLRTTWKSLLLDARIFNSRL